MAVEDIRSVLHLQLPPAGDQHSETGIIGLNRVGAVGLAAAPAAIAATPALLHISPELALLLFGIVIAGFCVVGIVALRTNAVTPVAMV